MSSATLVCSRAGGSAALGAQIKRRAARAECRPAASDGADRSACAARKAAWPRVLIEVSLGRRRNHDRRRQRPDRRRGRRRRGASGSRAALPATRAAPADAAQLSLPRSRSIAARARSLASRRSSGATAASTATAPATARRQRPQRGATGCTGDGSDLGGRLFARRHLVTARLGRDARGLGGRVGGLRPIRSLSALAGFRRRPSRSTWPFRRPLA